MMLDSGYIDSYRSLHKEVKGYTFPTWNPHVRLDYVFVPKVFSERVIECDVLIEPKETIAAASDHCPLLSRISW